MQQYADTCDCARSQANDRKNIQLACFRERSGGESSGVDAQTAARKAGVEGPSNSHAFRHGFAADHLLNGGDLATLCELMGHKDVGATKRFHARLFARPVMNHT
jgi:site-specific recombinase XerD